MPWVCHPPSDQKGGDSTGGTETPLQWDFASVSPSEAVPAGEKNFPALFGTHTHSSWCCLHRGTLTLRTLPSRGRDCSSALVPWDHRLELST